MRHDSTLAPAPVAAMLASLDSLLESMIERDSIKGRRRHRRAMRQAHGRKR